MIELNKKEFSFNFLGRKLVVEAGELAKQADGAVLVRYGDTVVLSASVMNDNISSADFFPLTIIYNEKIFIGIEAKADEKFGREISQELSKAKSNKMMLIFLKKLFFSSNSEMLPPKNCAYWFTKL